MAPCSGKGITTKLPQKWIGPLQVIEQTGPVNYTSSNLSGKKRSYIVNVERLKKYHERAEKFFLSDENLEQRQEDILHLDTNRRLLRDLFTVGQFSSDGKASIRVIS